MRRSQIVTNVLILRLPPLEQLQSFHRIVKTAPLQRQRPDEVLLVLLLAATAGIEEPPHTKVGVDVRGALVVLLQEVVVAFREVGGGGEEGVEFGGDDFLDFAIGRFGLGAEGVAETEGLFVGGWV